MCSRSFQNNSDSLYRIKDLEHDTKSDLLNSTIDYIQHSSVDVFTVILAVEMIPCQRTSRDLVVTVFQLRVVLFLSWLPTTARELS